RWASARDEGVSFWLRDDPSRRSAWLLVGDAARLGLAIAAAGPSLDARGDIERAVERYTTLGAVVDRNIATSSSDGRRSSTRRSPTRPRPPCSSGRGSRSSPP